MSKKYRLRQTLLMPGMLAIILPVGYEVELGDSLYHGEGGWYFAKHGVEDNKFHWEEIKEKERIEVRVRLGMASGKVASVEIRFSRLLNKESVSALKIEQAIEQILNDEQTSEAFWQKYSKEDRQNIESLATRLQRTQSGEFITKEECDRREMIAWEAGVLNGTCFHKQGKPLWVTFEDFKQSKK